MPDLQERTGANGRPSIGDGLRTARLERGLSLEEMSRTTRIPLRSLQHLEGDRYGELPGEVFVRGFLKAYTHAVGVDSDPYLDAYRGLCQPEEEAPAPILAVTQPERGRRFGIAIALVILLILFTLALSIVLRPRHRDRPIELSRACNTSDISSAPTRFSCDPSTIATRIASSHS